MGRPWVADGGDGLWLLRVYANKSRKADKGWSFNLGGGVGEGLITPYRKRITAFQKTLHKASDLGRILQKEKGMHLAQNRDQWRAFVETVMNCGIP